MVLYLTVMRGNAPQQEHSLREVFIGLRWIIRTSAQWRMMPNDLPPGYIVQQQTKRWLAAGVFEPIADNLRRIVRQSRVRSSLDSCTLQSTPESGQGAGFDGAKKRRGRKVHVAVDMLGHLLAVYVTAANEQDRAQVAELAEQVQALIGGAVQVAFVDQGYTSEQTAADVAAQGIRLAVIKPPDAKYGFILLPRRWVIERSIA